MSFGEEKLLVKHIKWNNWPDRGVPKHKMAPFRLLGRINNVEPVVIHCSAGAFIVLLVCIKVLGVNAILKKFKTFCLNNVENNEIKACLCPINISRHWPNWYNRWTSHGLESAFCWGGVGISERCEGTSNESPRLRPNGGAVHLYAPNAFKPRGEQRGCKVVRG